MRILLATLAALSLAATLPVASAGGEAPDVQCDVDDDLYQHCNVGPVHTVYGPFCVGVRVGGPAPCTDLRQLFEQTLA